MLEWKLLAKRSVYRQSTSTKLYANIKVHSSLVGYWGAERQWASELWSQVKENDKAGYFSWMKRWWENTELVSTLTESEVKVREEKKEGTSLDLSQAQNKMGIIWGQTGSGYQWLLLFWFLLKKVQVCGSMTKRREGWLERSQHYCFLLHWDFEIPPVMWSNIFPWDGALAKKGTAAVRGSGNSEIFSPPTSSAPPSPLPKYIVKSKYLTYKVILCL